MFFVTTHYCPDLRSKPYLILIKKKLKEQKNLEGNHDQYLKLLNLKKHTCQAAASFSQLNGLFDETTLANSSLPILEESISKAIGAVLKGQELPSHLKYSVKNSFALVQNFMADEGIRQNSLSICNLVTNSICTVIGLAAICAAAFAISTGGIGTIALGIGLALIATILALSSAYSLYVDGRYLANKQVEEIGSFIDALFAFNQKPLPIQQETASTLDNLNATVMPKLEPVYIPTMVNGR